VHTDEAEPQVFEALHMLSGWSSSHMYLLFFCACAVVELKKMALDNKSAVAPLLSRLSLLVISARLASPRKLCNYLSKLALAAQLLLKIRAGTIDSVPLDYINELPGILV